MTPLNCYLAIFIIDFDDHFKFSCATMHFFIVVIAVFHLKDFLVTQMHESIFILYLLEILLSQNVI